MDQRFIRNADVFGQESLNKLQNKRVAVFGVGGVGGYVAEALARSGINNIDLIDKDKVDITNINRQIIALTSTVGKYKAEVMKERILDINPAACVNAFNVFYLPQNADMFDFNKYDYIVDAVDNITAKLTLTVNADKCNTPIISAMGAGNKICPEMFTVADIYKTTDCPLARVMRKELKALGIKKLKVVYSKEPPKNSFGKNDVTGSTPFCPPVMGMIMASEVVKDLING